MRICKLTAIIMVLLVLAIYMPVQALAEDTSHPLIAPKEITAYVTLPQKTVNILLLGIDFGHKGYWGSGGKKHLEDCHTDAMMVAAINLEKRRVDLISLPRDTLTYVPGVRGIYKLNAAINCGKDMEEGLLKACQASSWLLGGIKIDYYYAVDMNTLIELGDAMGGVDYDLEMSYTGSSKTKYKKGLQHLNGTGITDYMRARKNATIASNDIGRTGRQRSLMRCIFEKLTSDLSLVGKMKLTIDQLQAGFYTNIDGIFSKDLLSLLPMFMQMDAQSIGSYVITGKYRTALKGWNFTFTDQDNRKEVIKKVYGIEVPELAFVSYPYTQWLMSQGFYVVRCLCVAEKILADVSLAGGDQNTGQKEAISNLEEAVAETKIFFEAASNAMTNSGNGAMNKAAKNLVKCGNAAAALFDTIEKPAWKTGKYWYADRMINAADVDFR